MGTVEDYTDLPTDTPTRVYGEVVCPGDDAPKDDDPLLDDRLFVLESGELWEWSGGDSAYMSGHGFSQWSYTKDDPAVKLWFAFIEQEPTTGGTATFYVENLGGGLKLGNLVLMPEDGKQALRLVYMNRTKVKWKTEKVDGTVRVKSIPFSVPIARECFSAVDEGWPTMEPATSFFYYGAGREVRELWGQGDQEGAKALLLKNDLLNKHRYADEELEQLLFFWSTMSDESIPTYPLLVDYKLADRSALWALIESKYDALVEAGQAPPRPGTEAAEDKADEPAAEDKADEPAAEDKADEPAAEDKADEPAAEDKPAEDSP